MDKGALFDAQCSGVDPDDLLRRIQPPEGIKS